MPRAQARVVERERALEPDLLPRREQQLDAGVRAVLGDEPARRLEHRRHRRLVVGAEDRAGRVPHHAVGDDRLDRRGRRDGVEVRAQEDRLARARSARARRRCSPSSSRSPAPCRPRRPRARSRAGSGSRGPRRRAPRPAGWAPRRARGTGQGRPAAPDGEATRPRRRRAGAPARAPPRRTRGRAAPDASAAT